MRSTRDQSVRRFSCAAPVGVVQPRSGFTRLVAAGLIGALVLSGCSLYNPHVRPDIEERDKALFDREVEFQGTLPKAIDYANKQRDMYYEAVGDQSRLRSGLALTLAPITAAALYLGITSSSSLSKDVITGLGIGAATAFGLGTYFENKTRQKVYLEGSRVIGCAIIAMSPLLMTVVDYNALSQHLAGIVSAAATVDQRIRVLDKMIADPDGLRSKWAAESTGFWNGANALRASLESERQGRQQEVTNLEKELEEAIEERRLLRQNQQRPYQSQIAPPPPQAEVPLDEAVVQQFIVPAAPSSETASAQDTTTQATLIEQAEARVRSLEGQLGAAKSALEEFSSALSAVGATIDARIRMLNILIAKSNEELEQRIKEAKAEITAAKELKGQAKTASDKGFGLEDRVDKAGLTLTTMVENIRDKVSLELVKTEPTLASITNITGNLGTLASEFAGTQLLPEAEPPGEPTPTPEEPSLVGVSEAAKAQAEQYLAALGEDPQTPVQRIEKAIDALQAAELALAIHANAVTALVQRTKKAAETAGDITSCQVQPVASDFKVEPDIEAIELKKPSDTYQFVVSGGVGMPGAVFFGERTKGMKAVPELEGGSFVIKISMEMGEDAPEDGPYQLRISDATGTASKTIEVKVLPAEPEPPPPGQDEDAGNVEMLRPVQSQILPTPQPQPKDHQSGLGTKTIKAIQTTLGQKVDGIIGPQTTGAIMAYQNSRGREVTGRLTPQDVKDILGLP